MATIGRPKRKRTKTNEDLAQQPLFEGSQLNVGASITLLMTFVREHSLSMSALDDLLKIVNLHLCNHSAHSFPSSIQEFHKFFQDRDTFVKKVFLCDVCDYYFGDSLPKRCPNDACAKTFGDADGKYFLLMPLEDQLKNLLPDWLPIITKYRESRAKEAGAIRDVLDGKLYKELFDDCHFRGTTPEKKATEQHLSVQLNTDGVALFRSSKMSVWPIFMTMNELPLSLRFTRPYRLLVGLWFGKDKPPMTVFLRPICAELHKLREEGMQVQLHKGTCTVRVVLLSAVLDAPARAAAQNFVQFNGYFGCNTCLHEGKSIRTKKGGSKMIFPYKPQDSRTKEGTIEAAHAAERIGKPQTGVKGLSWLTACPTFDIIRGVTVDYMHCVCLGVMKTLLDKWFGSKNKTEAFSLHTSVHVVDDRLLSIKPPLKVSRLPRSLREIGDWKASEYRAFLLFYGLPCLQRLLPDSYLAHFSLLVEGIYILLQERITVSDMNLAKDKLTKFAVDHETLYGEDSASFNLHCLSHLCTKVQDLGPLFTHSCFFYEDLNRDFKSLYFGTQNVDQQICRNVTIHQELPHLATQQLLPGSPAESLYKKMTSHNRVQGDLVQVTDQVCVVPNFTELHVSNPVISQVHKLLPGAKVAKFMRVIIKSCILNATFSARNRRVRKMSRRNNSGCLVSFEGKLKPALFRQGLRCTIEGLEPMFLAEVQCFDTEVASLPKHVIPVRESHTNTQVVPLSSIVQQAVIVEQPVGRYLCPFPNFTERE